MTQEIRKAVELVSTSKSFFFKNYDNKIDKPVANLIKNKGGGDHQHNLKWKKGKLLQKQKMQNNYIR